MYENLESIVNSRKDDIPRFRRAIINFCTLARASIISESTILGSFYEPYERMQPCLHRKFSEEKVIDLTAFSYALQRLPEEIAKVKEVYIKNNPEDLSCVPGIKLLECKARRRTTYCIDDDYIQMIAREGETDVFDIITSLIMYSREATKIKKILFGTSLLNEISEYKELKESEAKNKVISKLADRFSLKYEELKCVDKALDYKLFNIISNIMEQTPENMIIHFDHEFSVTDASKKAELWIEKVQKELESFGEKPIHLISSNTHGVVNCLTGFARDNYNQIIKLGKRQRLKLQGTKYLNQLYCLAQELSKIHEGLLEEKKTYEKELGIKFIKDDFNTGIDVQIIDLGRLDFKKMDPRIKVRKLHRKQPIILNIDYAFGKEGKYIMDELCENFGKRIKSISITGKAGIVCGNKYDIMLPTSVIPQIEGGIYHFPGQKNHLKVKHLEGLLEKEKVYTGGPMLTVPGTAIQNDLVMYDYMVRYGILGLEMEAAPYFDAIEKACERGILRKDIMLNVGYWGSDNPLNPSESLAESHMDKGFNPTYALIIAMLNNVFRI